MQRDETDELGHLKTPERGRSTTRHRREAASERRRVSSRDRQTPEHERSTTHQLRQQVSLERRRHSSRDRRTPDRGRSNTRRHRAYEVTEPRLRLSSHDRRQVTHLSRSRSRSSVIDDLQRREREFVRERERLRVREDEFKRDRSRLRDEADKPISSKRTHSQDDGECCPSLLRRGRSRSPLYTTKDIVSLLNSIVKTQPLGGGAPTHTSNTNHKNILPDFDQSTKGQRVDVWLKKVNECATVYGWDEKTTINFALQKLQGLAKTWYDSLDSILYTWPEWQQKLSNAFG